MKCETIVSLLHKPKALFLDEPTIGLDVISQRHLWEFLRDYQKQYETTVMLTSHNMQDIANLCSRVIVINLGKLVYDGTLTELIDLTQPMKEVTIQFQSTLTADEKSKLREILIGLEWSQPEDFTAQIFVPRERFSSITRQLLRDFRIDDIAVQEVDFSMVMKESFLMRPEEVPIRKIKNEFQRKISGTALNGD
jgi:ABC-2 type transport system ATP-binding protein